MQRQAQGKCHEVTEAASGAITEAETDVELVLLPNLKKEPVPHD